VIVHIGGLNVRGLKSEPEDGGVAMVELTLHSSTRVVADTVPPVRFGPFLVCLMVSLGSSCFH